MSKITILTPIGFAQASSPWCDAEITIGNENHTCGYNSDIDSVELLYVEIGALKIDRSCAIKAWGLDAIREAEDELILVEDERRESERADRIYDLRMEGVA